MTGFRSPGLLILCFALGACRRVPPLPPSAADSPDAGVVLVNLGRLEDPTPVAEAMITRPESPRKTLERLRDVWRLAVQAGDEKLEAYALDRSGDVTMDLLHAWRGDEARLEPAGADAGTASTDACTRARDDYLRAYTLAAQLGEPRFMGRVAHNLAWALERCGDEPQATAWYEIALVRRLAAHDAIGVRFTANNLGVIITGPKRRRYALYRLAVEGAQIAGDPVGERKAHTNIARLWFYSADTHWLDQDWTDGGPLDGYAMGPLRGVVRENFLLHLRAALDAAARANESPWDVCAGLAIEDDCSRWSGQPIEELFPEET
jgi:hypothetical protein